MPGRLVKGAVELGEYDVEYQNRTAIKAQVLADFVVEFVGEQVQEEKGGWLLHVDGSSNANNGGVGILLQGPNGLEIEVAARLSFPATNNKAEYEALILGLQLAREAGARDLNVCTNSQLVAMQIEGMYETRERTMTQYLAKVREQMECFNKCTIQQIPRNENKKADALSKFGVRRLDTFARYSHGASPNSMPVRSIGDRHSRTISPSDCTEEVHNSGVEYFTKWVEAEAVAKISEKEDINFIWKNIICRFGIPRVLISDNGTQFQEKAIVVWCRELKIEQNFTSVGNPQANGQTEVTNHTILQHLKTRLEGAKGSWVEELPEIGEETQRVSQYEAASNQMERTFDLTVIEEKRMPRTQEPSPQRAYDEELQ
ncbi:UNVERIFIED_CONTAM: Ribonuclease HI [Sesamum radiatum]|uniref:Ribonuclease HI n=1 Tax=Sesamum radiatum TaxID=300843 RepID=A0AAW2T6V2_SESRA